jgi:DNA-binding NarL/FixJ family response regulator
MLAPKRLPADRAWVRKGQAMHEASVKLLLADDSETLCKAIRAVLSGEPRIELLGEARSLPETVKMASMLQPDVILLDLHMPGEQGFEPSTVKIQFLTCSERVIAMSISNDDETKALALEYGAVVLLDKATLGSELIPTLLGSKPIPVLLNERKAET